MTQLTISLNFDNPEPKQILPWTGTSKGPQAFIDTFSRVAKWWTIENFAVTDLFGGGENFAVFGRFTYRSVSRGKAVTSRFSIHATVSDGKIVCFQFMEDTFAIARSFSQKGTWTQIVLKFEEYNYFRMQHSCGRKPSVENVPNRMKNPPRKRLQNIPAFVRIIHSTQAELNRAAHNIARAMSNHIFNFSAYSLRYIMFPNEGGRV